MISRSVYEMLTGDDDGRVCRDIPDEACVEQPRNFLVHVISLGATKTGDGLADPKLVLAWLLGALGAPSAAIGLLVPIREAGALLPQLFTAAAIRSRAQRKWVWAAGSLVQGLSVVGMAGAALAMTGAAAGWTIVGLLAIFAVGRSICSVSYKDVLGKTVSKSTRGTATGTASTIGAAAVLLFGLLLSFGIVSVSIGTISGALVAGGVLWILAACLFATLAEVPGASDGGGNPLQVAYDQIGLLGRDPQLVRFIATRALLTASALAPPYLLAIAGRESNGNPGALGPFVIAAALAAVSSTYFWGRLSDRSSRKVLTLSGAIAALPLGAAALAGLLSGDGLYGTWAAPLLLFVLMIAYQGVRLGRSTHLVDMADEDTRAAYTALSNTIIGIALVLGGAFGLVAQWANDATVLALFAVMCVCAAITARGLNEVQKD